MSNPNEQPTEAEIQAAEAKLNEEAGIVEIDDGTGHPGDEEEDDFEPYSTEGTDDDEPDDGSEGDDEDGSEINQEAIQKKIDTATFKRHEERRKREAIQRERDALKEEIERLKNPTVQPSDIVIPEVPDSLDPDFDTKMAERDKAIADKAKAESAAQVAQETAQKTAQQRAEEEVNELRRLSSEMYAAAEKEGISSADLKVADDRVAMFVGDRSLARFILEQGSDLVIALSGDVESLEKIGRMDPVSATAYIATSVLPKLSIKEKKAPSAPDPLKVPGKKGSPKKKNPFLEGVVIE
jgi:hypothetical protein